jgi:NADPH:quinone reductase-like Zn-dependent oxidoreductase
MPKALWYVEPGIAVLRDEQVAPGPDDLCVRAHFGAISRGTEALVFAGRVPQTEYQRMRGPHMGGVFPFPVKYGYAIVGTVHSGPPHLHGRMGFALHPHQDLFALPPDAFVPLPEGVPPQRAVLAANMETALNAVWDGAPGPADRIAVIGAGVVGALAAFLCAQLPGTDVVLVDIDPARAALARALGVTFASAGSAPKDCDLVFHASGSASGLATAFDLAGDEARIIEMSWYGAGETAIPLGGAFHSRRLTIASSQVGKVAPSHRPRWTPARRMAAALGLLRDARLDALIAPPIRFADLPAELPRILAPSSGVLCQRIDYPAAAS